MFINCSEVNKYRNKARFFEEQIVEKELEALQWKTKYEKDIDDHAKSQEALIHGFNAEISNLKTQIFHFKSQLYGVKSPVKSPGGTLRTPDAKMKLFPMSPLSTPSKDNSLNCSKSSHSPAKESTKQIVNDQVKALQNEMDKNCKMISELEHSLQLSKASAEDNEKRLVAETEKYKQLEEKLQQAEALAKTCTCRSVPEVKIENETKQTSEGSSSDIDERLKEKDAEINGLNNKIKELEPLMKDYFSTAKKLTDSEKNVKELQELLEENAIKVTKFEEKIKTLETDKNELQNQMSEKEASHSKLEEKFEELETLNTELKNVLDKTAFDLLAKDSELQVLSPKLERLKKLTEDEHQNTEGLKTDLKSKSEQNSQLRDKLSKLKLAYQVKCSSLQEATEKCSQHEFNCAELQIVNQELKEKAEKKSTEIVDLKYELEKFEAEVKKTGEELAIVNIDSIKYKTMIEELKVNITDLESAVTDKEVELCDKDKVIADKDDEIFRLKSMNDKVDGDKTENDKVRNDLMAENEKLKNELVENEKKCADIENEHVQKMKQMEGRYETSIAEINEQKKSVTEELNQMTQQFESVSEELKQVTQQFESVTEELKQVQEQFESVKENTNDHEDNRNKLVMLEAELRNKSEELHCAEKILVEVREVLKRRDEQLEELHNDLKKSHNTADASKKEIKKRDEQIKDLKELNSQLPEFRNTLSKKEEEILNLQSELSKKEQEICTSKNILSEKEVELSMLKETNLTENNANVLLDEKMKDMQSKHESDLKLLNDKFENGVKENEALKKELEELSLQHSEREVELLALQKQLNETKLSETKVEESNNSKKEAENKVKELLIRINELKDENTELQERIDKLNTMNNTDIELKSELERLKKENKNLDNEITSWKEAADRRDIALKEQIEKLELVEKINKELELEANKEKVEDDKDVTDDFKCQLSLKEEECETLKQELKALKEQMNENHETSCLSPGTGVRKLRKDKIEIQNNLIEAKYQISMYESKIKDLETKLMNAENNTETDTVHQKSSLQQVQINLLTKKLEDAEKSNLSLMKEVSEFQCQVKKLEADLKEEQSRKVLVERDIHRRSCASLLQAEIRQSISSPSSKIELAKLRETEGTLRDQLKESNNMIQDWTSQITDIESKLSIKIQELKHANDTIETLEKKMAESGCKIDQQLQEYMDKNNKLELEIIKKDGDIECNTRTIQNLQRQLNTESSLLKSLEKERGKQDHFVSLLKETLEEQENMLQLQSDMLDEKESNLQQAQSDHEEIKQKYKLLEKEKSGQNEGTQGEREILKQQLTEANDDKMKLLADLKERKSYINDIEKKMKKIQTEKNKLTSVIEENNHELKTMETNLTDAMKQIEELKSQGTDKCFDTKLEEIKQETETVKNELNNKIRNLQCQKKELEFQLNAEKEKHEKLTGDKQSMDKKLQEFRDERDKLVSGLESVLKKKDTEIKQHKDLIKQLKEKEIQLTKSWHEERQKIAAGLQELNGNTFHVKEEVTESSSIKEEPMYATVESCSKLRSPPPRPSPPKVTFKDDQQSDLEIHSLKESPGLNRRGSRTSNEVQNIESDESGSSKSRRRGKKRPSDEGLHDLPPLPKKQSKDRLSNMSESDDYSTHLQVDATPPVAAKTLRRTRKRNGSQVDLSKVEDTENQPRRSTRNRRNAKNRLLESFRDSPMGKTGKRLLDSIAETFSPKSPTRSPTRSPVKSPLREDNGPQSCSKDIRSSRDNLHCDTDTHDKKSSSSRGKSRHKLYKEDSYISEPFTSTGDFVQSQDESIHRTVTRSLRSRRQ
ncbi:hypothetical protein ACF0H5_019424 [Mactra antiquata]